MSFKSIWRLSIYVVTWFTLCASATSPNTAGSKRKSITSGTYLETDVFDNTTK